MEEKIWRKVGRYERKTMKEGWMGRNKRVG